jgi:predicted membrane-bound spermidine synthase
MPKRSPAKATAAPRNAVVDKPPARPGRGRAALLAAVFFVSGFAGLIYESIWTQYLKLFLGHAAYAQTLVLAIFMGGMAIGAALVARYSTALRAPLRVYAGIELAIGVLAIVFHPLFVSATDGLYHGALAWQWSGATFAAIKWTAAVLLILPQSILLGATFPVFAAAAVRDGAAAPGRPIATLYFANSLGGALGVVVSGFVLIPAIGLPGTITTAGAINLAIAAFVAWLGRARAVTEAPPQVAAKAGGRKPEPAAAKRSAATEVAPAEPVAVPQLLLAVAFLTGASSFVYEIGWIRMLSLVLGSATHSFELMLSSFILGLALGGLWIRSRIDTTRRPGRLLAWIQIAMGLAAVATIPLHTLTFDAIGWALRQAPRSDEGYAFFNLMRYGLASAIMFPAAFCAGMTLPLVTRLLIAAPGHGERAIGLVYSANTLGSIVGVMFAVHVGLPLIGLEYLVASGAVIDVLLGAALLAVYGGRRRLIQAGAALAASLVASVVAAKTFDPQKLASGVFRTGTAALAATVTDIAHGKTATITIDREGDVVTIRTNGKPDAQVNTRLATAYPPDEVTARLLGAVPLMLHADPKRVANIGMGSGLTGEMLLSDPRVKQLDTIEIEPAVIALAKRFGEANRLVYEDPRSAIHIDDAKAFFATHGARYDVIVSEPSNPWVSGVAGLFSVEFYRHAARYLNRGGLFVQWVQTYETSNDRVASIFKAMDAVFADYLVVALDDGDLLLAASADGKVTLPPDGFARLSAQVRQRLRPIDVATAADITFRISGNKAMFHPWLESRPVPANSDFRPYLDTHADRDLFLANELEGVQEFALSAWPVAEVLGARPPLPTPSSISFSRQFGPNPPWLAARLVAIDLFGPDPRPEVLPIPGNLPPQLIGQGRAILNGCRNPPNGDRDAAAAQFATRVLPHLSPAEGRDVLAALAGAACLQMSPGTPLQWPPLLRQVADRDARAFASTAERMLAGGLGANDVRARYLMGLSMLGYIAVGERAHAKAVWDKYSAAVLARGALDLPLDLLRAQAEARAP